MTKRVIAIEEAYAGHPRGTVFDIESDGDANAYIAAGWVQETDAELTQVEEAEPDLEEMTLDDLKDMARDKGLPVSGTKTELIERLGG